MCDHDGHAPGRTTPNGRGALITRRSQVRILPPLFENRLETGGFLAEGTGALGARGYQSGTNFATDTASIARSRVQVELLTEAVLSPGRLLSLYG